MPMTPRYPERTANFEGSLTSTGLLAKTLFMLVILFGAATVGFLASPLVPPALWGPFAIVQLLLIFGMTFFLRRSLFWAETVAIIFAFLNGLVLAPAIAGALASNPAAVGGALLATTVSFAAAALIVALTRLNFGSLVPFLFVGLLGLIVAGFLAIFLPSLFGLTFNPVYNLIGVVVFLGFTLVDFWRIKNRAYAWGDENVAAVFLSVSLYLDFVNLFLFFLRFFGINTGRRR